MKKKKVSAVSLNGNGSETTSLCTAIDSKNNVFIGGAFNGFLSGGGNTISYGGGISDGFIAKYGTLCTVGLAEPFSFSFGEASGVRIFPNHAHSFITVDFNLSNQKSNGELIIYNTLGEIVLRQILNKQNSSVKVDCSKLSTGIYYLSINSNGQQVSSGKFVKE